ncbi:NAD(P)-binding protein [Gloeopeniophorella convolvens]|nr:NAD(P)-binding protein [Gloeopeniophorella convolvens]
MLLSSASLARIPRAVAPAGRRAAHDLLSLPDRPRFAVTGHVATVFGCTGFLGRYLVAKLAKAGTQVVIPYREEDEKRHLKVTGDLGQIVPMEWDIRNEEQIAECVRHSDIVYNLVGREWETKNFKYDDVHVKGAERIAKVAAGVGVPRLVHVSHLNASSSSTSQLYRAKAAGEAAVREAFPTATIVRPGPMYGHEDKLLTNMSVWPVWWKLNHGQTKTRPVHVMDVAQALSNLEGMAPLARTLSLPGPSTLTYEYILELVSTLTYNPPSRAPVLPKRVALALARAAQQIWWPALSPDEVERRFIDDAPAPGDWAAVGVEPDEIENHAITYVRRYRSAANYIRPIVVPPRPLTAE